MWGLNVLYRCQILTVQRKMNRTKIRNRCWPSLQCCVYLQNCRGLTLAVRFWFVNTRTMPASQNSSLKYVLSTLLIYYENCAIVHIKRLKKANQIVKSDSHWITHRWYIHNSVSTSDRIDSSMLIAYCSLVIAVVMTITDNIISVCICHS